MKFNILSVYILYQLSALAFQSRKLLVLIIVCGCIRVCFTRNTRSQLKAIVKEDDAKDDTKKDEEENKDNRSLKNECFCLLCIMATWMSYNNPYL